MCCVPDLGGLQIGDQVRLDGIAIGYIDGVRILNDSSIMVFFLIEQKRQQFIKKSSAAMISSAGLMGSKILSIIPATQGTTLVQDGDTLRNLAPVSVDDILAGIKTTAMNAQTIAQNISLISKSTQGKKGMVGKLMYDKRFASNLDTAMNNFKGAKAKLNGTDAPAEEEPEKKKKGFRLFKKKENKEEADSAAKP